MQNQLRSSDLKVYGINAFINNFKKTDQELLDLNILKKKFKLDNTFDEELNQIEPGEYPAFTQLTYNERINKKLYSYSRPPLGPISNFCYCSVCNKIGPEYHAMDCDYPENRSLYLTFEGLYNYVIRNPNYSGSLKNLKSIWVSNKLTIEILEKYLIGDYFIDIEDGKIEERDQINNKNVYTNIQYLDVIKIKGPDKIEYRTATTSFDSSMFITYQLNENSKTSIRISKNGKINLINIPENEISKNEMYSQIVQRLNEYPDLLKEQYKIIPEITYTHSINSQFYMFENKDSVVNLDYLYSNINNLNDLGKLINSQFTQIENDTIIRLISPITNKSIKIYKFEYSKGKMTSNQTVTREEIKCTIIPFEGIKIKLSIFKSGVFQMSMSYCNINDIRNKLCTKLLSKHLNNLKIEYLNLVREIFIDVFNSEKEFYNYNELIHNQELTNTISGKKTIYQEGKTEVCRKIDRGVGKRPIPYTWKGRCPESMHYLEFKGVFSHNDGKYYPCCASKSKESEERLKKYLVTGFPKDNNEGIYYGVNKQIDTKSGILESVSIGSTTEATIDDTSKKIKILAPADKKVTPTKFQVEILETGKKIIINRDQLKKDSRYFPGLKDFSKQQLIKCILNKYNFITNQSINEDNLKQLNKYITVSSELYNNIFSIHNINIFKEHPFYVTSVPVNSKQKYLFLSPDNNYIIDKFGNKNLFDIQDEISDIIVFNGYYINEKYYIIDLLYYNDKIIFDFDTKIDLMNELENIYFLSDNNIFICDFQNNIIKTSSNLLNENNNISLIFIPKYDNSHLYYKEWNPNLIVDKSIILQLITILKTNHYSVGYNNRIINNTGVNLDDILINKIFRDSQKINLKDYVLFDFEYNLSTNELSKNFLKPIKKFNYPELNLNDTLTKISLILFPIKDSFFINTNINGEDIWITRLETLKYIDDDRPLQNS